MHKTDVISLISYAFWADNEILNACEQASAADFTRQAAPDPGWHSLRGTLVHLLDTEYGWRVALQNLSDAGEFAETDFADIQSLKARWREEQAAWLAYIADLSEEDLNAVWHTDGAIRRTRSQTILHVVNDGTYHRSEAAAMLTGYGCSPGELDYEGYLVWIASQG